MELFFEKMIENAANAPHMIFVSFAMAVAFVIGGIVLYVKRDKLKGWRWPGITCAVLGCASLVTTSIQYFA